MAIYTEKLRTFEPIQYIPGSKDGTTLDMKTYDGYADDGKRICEKCGQALSLHGVEEKSVFGILAWGTVCPGTWFVPQYDGTVKKMLPDEFAATYEEVKV